MSSIRAEVNYEGTEEGADALDGLLGRLDALESAQRRAAGATDSFEQQLKEATTAQSSLGSATGDGIRAQNVFANTARGAAVRVEEAKNKTEALASAMGSLGSAMKGINPEIDALGDSISAAGQGLSVMQSMPGPLGIALGSLTATIGIARTAIQYFERDTVEMAREVAAEVIPTLDDLISKFEETARAAARSSRVSMGLGSRAEMAAAVEEAEGNVERLEATLTALQANERSYRERASQGLLVTTEQLDRFETHIEQTRDRLHQARLDRDEARRQQRIAAAEETVDMERQLAEAAREDAERNAPQQQRRRASNDNGLSSLGGDILGELDEAAALAAEVDAEQIAAAEEKLRIENARIDARRELAEWEMQLASAEKDRLNEQWELEQEIREHNEEAEEKAKQKRLADAREITSSIEGTLQLVASSYIDAFGSAIEGQKTLEEASLEATASLLKAIGEQMVAIGIRETLEGFANIVADPPVAATKIPMGIALIAAGAGLGAAGAAIPSQPSAPPESPRRDEDRGGGDGGTLVLNYNSPFITSGTTGQLSRQMRRQIDSGRGFDTRSNAA